jgi:hypothetical protein
VSLSGHHDHLLLQDRDDLQVFRDHRKGQECQVHLVAAQLPKDLLRAPGADANVDVRMESPISLQETRQDVHAHAHAARETYAPPS